jgi:hypothetical protein
VTPIDPVHVRYMGFVHRMVLFTVWTVSRTRKSVSCMACIAAGCS